jgi:hypothetical protein
MSPGRSWSPGRLLSTAAISFAALAGLVPAAASAKGAPKPLEPEHALKPPEGYFDEAFALEPGAARLYVVRTDGATFWKLEVVDVATGKTSASFDLPKGQMAIERLEPLPDGKGVVVIARQGATETSALVATLIDGAGKAGPKVGPASGFGRPSTAPDVLVAFDRKPGAHEVDVTYTITPYKLETLAPAGKPRTYKATGGELKTPPFRVLDFVDGYGRIVGERPRAYVKKDDVREPPRMAVLDTLTGKISDEAAIVDVVGWAQASRLRGRHPGRAVFADLNQDTPGVDVVDAMGKKQPVELAVPFVLYDGKTLTDQEGPEPGALYFGIAVDPVNPEAVKRKKADLPMLDIYGAKGKDDAPVLRGRVFIPRNVVWRAGWGKVVVLRRFKSFTAGGDELDVYKLH